MVFKEWFKVRDGQRFLENKNSKEKSLDGLYGALNMLDDKHMEKLRIVMFGGIASSVTKTMYAPIERLKIELQTCRHLRRQIRSQTAASEIITYALIGSSTASMDVQKLVRTKGIFGYMKHVAENEGWTSLFRGNGLNITRVVPTSFMKFAFFDIYRNLSTYIFTSSQVLSKLPEYEKDFLIVFTSALMSGINLTVFAYPLDLVRTRLTVIKYYSKYNFKSSFFPYLGTAYRCVRELLKHEGMFALWKGMGASMVGVVPYVTCSITTYEYLKKTAHSRIEELNGGQIEKGSMSDHGLKLTYGTISSFLGKTLSYPADTVRRRRQLMGCMPSMIDTAVLPHSDIHDRSLPKPNLIRLEADEFSSGVTRYGSAAIKSEGSASTSTIEPLFTQKGQPMYKNTFHAFYRIIQEEGFAALFRGWKLNALRVVPGHAIHFLIYEELKQLFGYDKTLLTDDEDDDDDDDL